MKIRKYTAATEKEAMLKVKAELGGEAMIVSVKNIKPKWFFGWFKKPFVEVTAAIDDRKVAKESKEFELPVKEVVAQQSVIDDEVSAFKQFITQYSALQAEKPAHQHSDTTDLKEPLSETMASKKFTPNKSDSKNGMSELPEEETDVVAPLIEVVYDQLLSNEVDEKIANELVKGLLSIGEPELEEAIGVVYQRIIKKLSGYRTIKLSANGPRVVFFVGPTGVGKTTTIAKIASLYSLYYNKRVAFITSDTYRIAAVEQLKTYANILGVPIKVVYHEKELLPCIEDFSDKDLILVDTAGRSYRNKEHQEELKLLLDAVPDKEVYLVLSVATKTHDLEKVVLAYQMITEFSIIFTKLDETDTYGNILNIKEMTGEALSYIAFGQNVPDDLSEMNPHLIAKSILGGDE